MGKYKDNPWLGLESYQENQIIYGRNKEIEELSQGVLNNNETVLYGKSGIGKSSIINAGILPIVRAHGYFPIVVRLDHSNKHSYIKQLSDLIKMGAHVSECTIAKPIEEQLLWEYFHTHRFNKTKEEKSRLVVIFDQFEEIFTLQNNAAIKGQFFKELGDFLNNVMPKGLTEEYPDETTNSQSSTTKLESVSGFADMADLFSSLVANVNNSTSKYIYDNEIHFVFTLREDFLPEFEYHTSKIPSLKQHRYGLRPLNEEQAAEVILKPRPELVDEGVARLIIETVTNHTDFSLGDEPEIDVDAAVLSLFLSQIYDKRATIESSISVDLVKTFGKDIIKDFYEEAIEGLSSQQIDFLEEELLTGENRRDSLSRADFKAGGFSENELKRLIDNKKILRQFHYEGDLRVEFIHDILCPVVKERKNQRIQLKQHKAKLQAAIEKAKMAEEQTLKVKNENRRLMKFIFLFVILATITGFMYIKARRSTIMSQISESKAVLREALYMAREGDVLHAIQLANSVSPKDWENPERPLIAETEEVYRELYDSLKNGYSYTKIKAHLGEVLDANFSPDSKYIITGSNDCYAKIWEITTGRLVGIIDHKQLSVLKCGWINNDIIFTEDYDYKTHYWDSKTLKEIQEPIGDELKKIEYPDENVSLGKVSPDKMYKLIGYENGELQIFHNNIFGSWSNTTYTLQKKLCSYWEDSNDIIDDDLRISENDDSILINKSCEIYNINRPHSNKRDFVRAMAIDHNHRYLAIAVSHNIYITKFSDDYRISDWNLVGQHRNNVLSLSFNSKGNILASKSPDKTIRIWDVENLKELDSKTLFVPKDYGSGEISFSPDDEYIVSKDGEDIVVWNYSTSRVVYRKVAPSDFIENDSEIVYFDNTGKSIICVCDHKYKFDFLSINKIFHYIRNLPVDDHYLKKTKIVKGITSDEE